MCLTVLFSASDSSSQFLAPYKFLCMYDDDWVLLLLLYALCFTISLRVLFGLPLRLGPCTSYSMHFFTQPPSSFCNTCPYYHSLFCCSTNVMSHIPNLSQLLTWKSVFYLNATHSHLCTLNCHLIFFLQARSHFHETYCFAHNCCTPSFHNK